MAEPKTPDLSESSLGRWMELLPEKLRLSLGQLTQGDPRQLSPFLSELGETGSTSLAGMLENHAALLDEMGRPARVRLLAWLSSQLHEFEPEVFANIVARNDEDGEERKSGDLFAGDIEAIVEAYLADRLLAQMTERETVDLVRGAALTMGQTPAPEQGGPANA